MRLRVRTGELEGSFQDLDVPEAALRGKYRAALSLLAEKHGRDQVGDYLEFGVYAGTTLSCMHEALVEEGLDHVRLFGFDSFEGLPKTTHEDDTARLGIWRPGDLEVPLELARANLTRRGVAWERVTLVKGWFDQTLTPELVEEHGIRKAGVIMIDSDLYSSARTALEFCAPFILDEAVLLFDDWGPDVDAANLGERRAFEEFLARHPYFAATELETYQPGGAKVFLVSRRADAMPDGETLHEGAERG